LKNFLLEFLFILFSLEKFSGTEATPTPSAIGSGRTHADAPPVSIMPPISGDFATTAAQFRHSLGRVIPPPAQIETPSTIAIGDFGYDHPPPPSH
jgi:hypothetical protein